MPTQDNYTQRLGLAELDVYLDTPDNDGTYFNIVGVPGIAGYGKHSFQISYNDPDDTDLVLKQSSGIIFEFVDANGETIFSELSDIPDASGAASAYFWIKKDPLWLAQEIADGPATLYVVGELDNVPEEYAGTYNVRSTYTFDIRKSQPNTSKIVFYDIPGLEQSSSVSGDIVEFDRGSNTFARGYIEVSASHMETHGGQVNFIELGYLESGSRTDEFTILTEYELEGSASRYELESTSSVDGLNPLSHIYKMPVPRDFRRDSSVKFRLRFLNSDKSPAKYYDEVKNDQIIEITSSFIEVSGTPFIIEKEDNLLKGSMFTGNAVGKGFETSGKNSAFMKTVDYTGFVSASAGSGSAGVMFFSGSVLPGSGDEYQGVGLELHGGKGSGSFRFRSNPSLLEIEANTFFVGSRDNQFISGSGGNIEISSSNFHLDADGDVRMAGTIEAADGKIGGFHISQSRINSENEKIILKAGGQISASSLLLASGSFVVDPDNLSRFGSDDFQSFVMVENSGVVLQTSNFNLNTARFIMSSSDVGVLAVGSTPPLDYDNGTGFYVDGDGNFLVGKSSGPRIQFDGFNTTISSSNFFLGSNSQFLSGSLGNIEISSSNFHLDADGNVDMAGTITATAGTIGGFNITSDALSSNNFFISGAATEAELFISSSGFSVDATGIVSASALSLQGGDVGGLAVAEGTVSVGEILKLKDSGQITGSQVLFTGGKIAAFKLTDDAFSTSTFFISASATGDDKFISTNNFNIKASGDITGSQVLFSGGTIGGFELASTQLNSTNDNLILKDSGQITGSSVLFDGGKIAAFNLSNDALSTSTFFISASATGDDKFISTDNFNVKATGDITGSQVLFTGGKIAAFKITEDALSSGNNFFISASATNRDLFISSSEFKVRATGEITGSEVLFTKGKIAGWTISGTTLLGANATLDGAGSALFKTDQGPDTDNSAALDELRNEYYIDFTPEGQGNTRNFFVKFGPNFMVDSDGILIASGATFVGTITASAGLIGGFTTDEHAFHSSNIFISGSPKVGGTDHPSFMFISSSNFNVKENGDITGSSALFDGDIDVTGTGTIASFTLNSDEIKSSNDKLRLKSSGEITGSQVLFTGGKIADFTVDGHSLTTTGVEINDSSQTLFISSSAFKVKHDGEITGSRVLFSGGKIADFTIDGTRLKQGNSFHLDGASDATYFISSSDFQVKPSGEVTGSQVLFTGGRIAGFTLDGNTLTATNFTLDASGKSISLGNNNDIFIADADDGIQLGHATFASAPFSVTKGGFLKATAGEIGGFGISSTSITSSNDNLILKDSGQITGSTVLFTGGKIGGFTIDADEIKSTNLLLDSTNEKITVGSANAITIQGGGTDNFIVMGSKSAFAQSSTAGVILGMDNDVPSFDMTRNATNYMRFDTSTGVDIKTDTFKLDTTNLDIDSSTSRVQVHNGSNEVVRLGEISDSASDLYGLKIYDGSGTADSNTLVKLGGEGNTIGGWTITNSQIQSNNLIIHSSGRLETADFASGVKGWRIDATDNGRAEFENVTIRGTLSTAVFEKETVNAVGGQLYVANSTALTGSATISASFNTMSVVNVSGFTGSYGNGHGEILSLKKISDTGFTTEYIKVQSASRNDPSSDTDLTGKLFVIRGYSGSLGTETGSLGGSPSVAQDYTEGQVVVSTGVKGTGYIRLNANPNDSATPYIDIVERTGSAIYDVELKTRVGDLSGLSSATLFGNADPGFGIFTENGFFKGGINATTGSFTGVVHINTSANEVMKLGTNVSGTDDGIFVNNNNFLFTDGQFKTGNATNFISHDGSGDLQINTQNFELKGGSKLLLNTNRLVFDTSNASTATRTSGTGTFLSASGQFRVGEGGGNRIDYDGSKQIEIVTDNLNIDTAKFKLVTTGSGTGVNLALGDTPPTGIAGSNRGFYVSSSGAFLAGRADGNHIKFDGTNVQVSGEIDITAGDLAGITPDSISGSSGALSSSAAASIAGTAADSSSMAASVKLKSTGMDVLDGSGNALAQFGATVTVGQDADDKSRMVLDANSLDLIVDSGGTDTNFASFGAVTRIGDVANEHISMSSAGMTVKDGSTVRAVFGSDITIGENQNNKSRIFIDSDSVDLLVKDGSGDDTNFASFGEVSRVGDVANEHISMSSAGFFIKDGGTQLGKFISKGVTIGDTSKTHISASTFNMNIVDANNNVSASFGATTTIGPVSTEHIEISSGSFKLKNGSTTNIIMNSAGMQLGSVGNGITFDTSGNATFNGSITISPGDLPAGTVSGSAQLADAISGSSEEISASLAAQTAATLVDSASVAAAVQLTSNGMNILNSGGNKLAEYGANVFVGLQDAEHVKISTSGLEIKDDSTVAGKFTGKGAIIGRTDGGHISASTFDVHIKRDDDNFSKMDADSFDIVLNGKTSASFGATTTIGSTEASHTFIDSGSFRLKDGNNVRLQMDAKGIRMGNQFSVDSDGDATFSGTLTIGSALAESISGSVGSVSSSLASQQTETAGNLTDASSSLAAQTAATLVDSASVAASVQITNEGLNILNSSNAKISEFGANVFVGLQDAEHVKISSAGLELKDDSTVVGKFVPGGATIGNPVGNAHISMSTDDISIITGSNRAVLRTTGLEITQSGVGYAQFAGTTTIGNTATEHVEITSTTLKLRDGTTDRITMNSSGVQIGAVNSGITLNSDGDATFKGALTIGGLVSGSAQLADAISGSSGDVSASLAAQTAATLVDSASMAASVQITSTGMNILNGSGLKLAEYGATVTIGQDADDKSRMVLGATSLDLIVDDGGTDTNFASFGAVTRIGDVANEHISMSSAGMTIKDGGDVIGKFVAGGATLGKTAGAHISASTLDVHIIKDSDNKAVLDSDSFDIVLNGATSASFGATTTIGSAIGQHVKITNDAFEIKTDANTTVLSASSAGLEMQGTVRADAGELAGFTIGPLDRNQPPRVLSTNEDSSTSGSSLYTSVLHNLSSATSSILISPAVQAPFGLNQAEARPTIALTSMSQSFGGGFELSTKPGSTTTGVQMIMGRALAPGVVSPVGGIRALMVANNTDPSDLAHPVSTFSLKTHSSGSSQFDSGQAYSSSKGVLAATGFLLETGVSGSDSKVGFTIGAKHGSFFSFSKPFGGVGSLTISSSNFSIQGGGVTASGDITAESGIFKNVIVAGRLVTPERTGSYSGDQGMNGTPLTVESWYPYQGLDFEEDSELIPTGENPVVISGSIDDLELSVWGWTYSGTDSSGNGKSGDDLLCTWSCTDEAGVYSLVSGTTDQGPSNPPSSLFKFVSETDGIEHYDAQTQTDLFSGNTLSALGKGPKMCIAAEGDNSAAYYINTNGGKHILTSKAMKLPITGSEADGGLREILLEYAVRPTGAFGGFNPTYTTRILNAADSSVLFQTGVGGKSEDGTAQKWQIISFPIVSSAGLVSFPTAAGNDISVINEIRIQIEIQSFTSGGGSPHGHMFTEMRLREVPFANGLTANSINTNLLGTYLKSQNNNFITSLAPIHIGPNPADDEEMQTLSETLTQLNKGEIELWKTSGDPSIQFRIDTTDVFTLGVDDSDSDKFKITSGGSLSATGDFELDSSGNADFAGDVVAFYTSDKRLKDNIRVIEEPIEKVKQLKGVEYEWNNLQSHYESGSLDSGIIAQDVEKVLPQLVKERKTGYLGVRHDRLVGLLVEAIKEQQKQIDEMKEELEELKDGSS